MSVVVEVEALRILQTNILNGEADENDAMYLDYIIDLLHKQDKEIEG